MDNDTMILEFQTHAEAQSCLDAINALAAAYWTGQGYTVVVNPETGRSELIGKNAATGVDDPAAARTTTWDEIRESPVGTFYFASLSSDPRFANGMQQIPTETFGYVEKPMPPEWLAQ